MCIYHFSLKNINKLSCIAWRKRRELCWSYSGIDFIAICSLYSVCWAHEQPEISLTVVWRKSWPRGTLGTWCRLWEAEGCLADGFIFLSCVLMTIWILSHSFCAMPLRSRKEILFSKSFPGIQKKGLDVCLWLIPRQPHFFWLRLSLPSSPPELAAKWKPRFFPLRNWVEGA